MKDISLIEFLAHLATLVAACVAVYGINAWRQAHRGTKQIDLAEETLALFYQADDAIKYIRNPGGFVAETEGITRGERESEKEFSARKNASVVFKRFQDQSEVFSKIHSMRYRFLATFGKEASKPFDELNDIAWEIKRSSIRLSRLWAQDIFDTPERVEAHYAEIEKYEAVFWSGFDNDPLGPRIQSCIESIEKICRSIIEHGVEFRSSRRVDA